MLTKQSNAGVCLFFVALLLLTIPALEAQQTSIKIAVVDLERVFILSDAGKRLQAKLEGFQQEVQAEGNRRTDEANEIRRRATEGGISLTETQLAEFQREYEAKAVEIRRFRDDKQREGEKIKNEGLREIELMLEPVFKQIRDERGYDLILNNVPGIVVMASEKIDITAEVVERLNARQRPGG